MPKIEEIYAFISYDKDTDDEGVTAQWLPNAGGWIPLVGADIARVRSMMQIAQLIADKSGKPVKLIRFSKREEMKTLVPTTHVEDRYLKSVREHSSGAYLKSVGEHWEATHNKDVER